MFSGVHEVCTQALILTPWRVPGVRGIRKGRGEKMEIKKHNSRWFGVTGEEGRKEKLEVLISNSVSVVWEKVTAERADCASCHVRQEWCEVSGCFSHEKINETTQVKEIA